MKIRFCSFEAGFTLVEVMVALVILSIGLLGLAGLQAQGLSGSTDASLQSQAVLYVYDMTERMRTNRDAATATSKPYELDFGDTPAATLPAVVKDDLDDWLAQLATLPNGQGAIAVDTSGAGTEVVVSVRYSEKGNLRTASVDTRL